ncbi:hypothetical protein [Flavobacterium sp. PL002]|uniref:hypothetical protein n=1 Tax=Flavobacterium sp. PL002 TaxID=1897058 RepID=UPI001787C956|nr:hypothetical protein [Flavobacterium sp. PL002]MBE0390194.1 hypothetical protein [Flavobacterium sp. PL002]
MCCKTELINNLLNESLNVQSGCIVKLEEKNKISDDLIELLIQRHTDTKNELLEVQKELSALKRTKEIIKIFN